MTNPVISHEENISHQKSLSVIKAIGAFKGLTGSQMLDPAATPFFDSWKAQQNSQTLSVEEITYSTEELACFKKSSLYNIKLNKDDWCELTDLHMLDAVNSWEKLLKQALVLGVDWQLNNYDPEGLELAIEEQEQVYDLDASEERRQADAYYYSTRGC